MADIRTILFDLDGTLADTAPDMATALNQLLAREGREPLPFAVIRPEASHGSIALIKLGFGVTANDAGFETLKTRFLETYRQNLCAQTRLFPGVRETLAGLKTRGLIWGIVTNKPSFLTDPLVDHLGLKQNAACVISGDTTDNRKPHPGPILHACQLTVSAPQRCLYVGDAERDIQAGKEAGLKTLVALFGYIRENENPLQWGADGMISTSLEILDWVDNRA